MTRPDPAGSRSAPTGWPGAMGPVPASPLPADRRPGIATAAAVLGFVEAGLVLLLLALVGGLAVDVGRSPLGFSATAGAAALSGSLILGGVRLLRGVGWRLLVGATAVEIAGLLTLVALAAVAGGWPDGGVIVTLVLLLALPTVRMGLVLPRSVAAWVERQDPAPDRWL